MSASSLHPSRRALLTAGAICLLVAGTLTWAWRSVIFDHTEWPPAHTRVVQVFHPKAEAPIVEQLSAEDLPPSGGFLLRMSSESPPARP